MPEMNDHHLWETKLTLVRWSTKSKLRLFYGLYLDKDEAEYEVLESCPGWRLVKRVVTKDGMITESETYTL